MPDPTPDVVLNILARHCPRYHRLICLSTDPPVYRYELIVPKLSRDDMEVAAEFPPGYLAYSDEGLADYLSDQIGKVEPTQVARIRRFLLNYTHDNPASLFPKINSGKRNPNRKPL